MATMAEDEAGVSMDDILPSSAASDRQHEPSQAVFQQEWQIYRTLVDENYLFHREAYACLHQILVEEVANPFRFLDIACGDATASVDALLGTPIAHYCGIDLSAAALDLARQTLAVLACPVTFEQADFVEALRDWSAPVDVVWIGLSLHHMRSPEKLTVMRDIRRILSPRGLLVIYEPTSPDGEDRAGWLRRWDTQQPLWSAYTPAQWERFTAHVHAADYPETVSQWLALARAAGFPKMREVFATPSDLLRLYLLGPGA
jgi:SAM-dependent methyltransferase